MSRTNRSNIRRNRFIDLVNGEELEFHPELVPVDGQLSSTDARAALDAVIRAHRWQLVIAAKNRLRNDAHAEDLVQNLCVEVLEGQLPLPADPTEALVALLLEIQRSGAIRGDH